MNHVGLIEKKNSRDPDGVKIHAEHEQLAIMDDD